TPLLPFRCIPEFVGVTVDVVVGENWLLRHKAEMVCHEKVVKMLDNLESASGALKCSKELVGFTHCCQNRISYEFVQGRRDLRRSCGLDVFGKARCLNDCRVQGEVGSMVTSCGKHLDVNGHVEVYDYAFWVNQCTSGFHRVNEPGGVRVAREDDRGVSEGREDVREVFQQRGSGAKRKLFSHCGRNHIGMSDLGIAEGANDFVYFMTREARNLEACLETGRRWLLVVAQQLKVLMPGLHGSVVGLIIDVMYEEGYGSCGSTYLAYSKWKVEYQGSSGLLYNCSYRVEVEKITKDIVVKLPSVSSGYDAIWVYMDVLHLKHGMERNVGYRFMGRNANYTNVLAGSSGKLLNYAGRLWWVEGLPWDVEYVWKGKTSLTELCRTFEILIQFDELRGGVLLLPPCGGSKAISRLDSDFGSEGYCDNHDLSRLDNQSIERDRLIGIGFVLNFVKFISFTFGDKEMISAIEAVSRLLCKVMTFGRARRGSTDIYVSKVSFMRILRLREVARATARIALEFASEFVYVYCMDFVESLRTTLEKVIRKNCFPIVTAEIRNATADKTMFGPHETEFSSDQLWLLLIPPSTYILWICVVPTSAEIINGSSPVSSVFLGRSKHFQRWLKHFHALEGSQRTLGDNSQHRNDLGMERDCQHGSFILQLGAEVARVGEDDFGLGERRSGFARGRKGMGEASTVVLGLLGGKEDFLGE
ncbi:hypothetical protein Tco_0440074, partial [Tanacetum coccineum]